MMVGVACGEDAVGPETSPEAGVRDVGPGLDGGRIEDAGTPDAEGRDASARADAAPSDGGTPTDGGAPADAGIRDGGAPLDAGTPSDAAVPFDAGMQFDAGTPDSGAADSGPRDGGHVDGGPRLTTSTFIGGPGIGNSSVPIGGEAIRQCLVSAAGDLILGASAVESAPVTAGAYQRTYAGGAYNGDSWLGRMTLDLTQLTAATYLGGSANEREVYAFAERSNGDIVLGGHTDSFDFPTTPGAYDRTYNGVGDGYVAIMSASLGQLRAATFVGGMFADTVRGDLVLGPSDEVWILGTTQSPNYPSLNGFQNSYGGGFNDGFITALTPNLNGLVWSTFFGGNDFNPSEYVANGVRVGNDLVFFGSSPGQAFLENLATGPDRVAAPLGIVDTFVARLNPTTRQIVWLNIVNDDVQHDWAENGLTTDSAGNYIFVGVTEGDGMTTPGAADTTFGGGGGDCYVASVAANGSGVRWATLIGGSGYDTCLAPNVDSAGNVIVVGRTASADFPVTAGAYDRTHNGMDDAFVAILSADGSTLRYATFVGGPDDEYFRWACLDPAGDVLYAVGWSRSPTFPTTAGVYQPSFGGGGQDMVVTRFALR